MTAVPILWEMAVKGTNFEDHQCWSIGNRGHCRCCRKIDCRIQVEYFDIVCIHTQAYDNVGIEASSLYCTHDLGKGAGSLHFGGWPV